MPDCRSEQARRVGRVPAAYSALWLAGLPLAALYLLWRGLRQPQYRRHWGERFGLRAAPGAGPADDAPGAWTLWIHAVSVGETRACAPLLRALADAHPDARILLTHMTPTGRATGHELYAPLLGARLRQRYLPYDHPWAVRRFLAQERPRIGLVMETEIWPNLFTLACAAGVRMAVVNGRLSERSMRRGLRYRAWIEPAVMALQRIAVQTADDAARVARFGRDDAAVTGNLKFDQPLDEAGIARGRRWRQAFGARGIVVAASTRDGEEALLLDAWVQSQNGTVHADGSAHAGGTTHADGTSGAAAAPAVAAAASAPVLVIVPRHPQRFDEVARRIASVAQRHGLSSIRRSDPDWERRPADIVLGDSMGEMASWYAMADVAVIGGSLLPFGAQNLIEACAIGCPVLLGPSVFNFAQAAADALATGAALPVADAPAATALARALLADPPRLQEIGDAGRRFAGAHRGATQRTMQVIAPLFGQ